MLGRIAVLVDTENIGVSHAEAIFSYVQQHGDATVVRLFGDFTRNGSARWLDLARCNGYATILQLATGAGRNATDIALVIDAMDILFAGSVEAFCLVSDDRDFIPLAVRLRAAGKRVYAVCKTLDSRLKRVCTDVLELADEPPIVQAFRSVAGGATRMNFAQAAQLLRRHAPELVPSGAGKLRKSLMETGWFREEGAAATLSLVLKRPAA